MKSKPILLINGDSVLDAAAIQVMYSYISTPTTPLTDTAYLILYGINKYGEQIIGRCKLTAGSDPKEVVGACFSPVKIREYIAIRYELVLTSGSNFCSLFTPKIVTNVQTIDAALLGTADIVQ